MRYLKIYCIYTAVLSLLLLSPVVSGASAPSCIKKYTVEDGLSQNMIYCIHQDSKGYMWFGTMDGLNRFDGSEFTLFNDEVLDSNRGMPKGFFSILETEDGRLWFGTTRGVYTYDMSLERFSNFNLICSDGRLFTGKVRDLCPDANGNVWIAGQNGCLFKWDAAKNKTSLYSLPDILHKGCELNVRDIVVAKNGKIYIASYGDGILVFDPMTVEIEKLMIGGGFETCDVNAICFDGDCRLLAATSSDGLLEIDPLTGDCRHFLDRRYDGLFVRSVKLSSDGRFWIGTETGLYIYDEDDGSMYLMEYHPADPYSLSDNAIYAIYEDMDDRMWVGTFFGGVNYIDKSTTFTKFYPIYGKNSIGGKSISEFEQDRSGNIWVATEDAGLYRFNPRSRSFSEVKIGASNIHALMCEGDMIWVGSFTMGLYLIDAVSGRVVKRWTESSGLLSDNIYSIFKDSSGRIWVGSMYGLQYYDPLSDSFIKVQDRFIKSQVNDIIEDRRGVLWFATLGEGLWTYDREQEEWKRYMLENGTDSYYYNEYINCLHEDADGNIYAGTEGHGLWIYDTLADMFVCRADHSSGLPNDVIYSLQSDESGNIWGSTNQGLFKLDRATSTIQIYTHRSGLLCDQFNYKSGYVDRDGTMYFGGVMGFVSFDPELLPVENHQHRVFLSSLMVNNERVKIADGTLNLLERSISETEELSIPHDVSAFSLGLSEINFAYQSECTCYYMLEGWDQMWLKGTLPTLVTYSNLPSGVYTFRVRLGTDPDSAMDLVSLRIVILQPLWWSWWAKLLYLVILICLALLFVYQYKMKLKKAKADADAAIQKQMEKDIYNSKINFFANITHEIRTPLSLIRLPLNEVMSLVSKNNPQYRNLLMMSENVDRLMNLVNQLLDFRNVDGGTVKVSFLHKDVSRMVRKTWDRFLPTVNLKQITYKMDLPEKLDADVEPEMFTKIISNLLSNAMKHARSIIEVRLFSEGDSFCLSVINDGDAIPEDLNQKIFTPFFKVEETSEGFGIGLPYCRALAEVHKGDVSLVSRDDDMIEFRVTLPLIQDEAIRVGGTEVKTEVGQFVTHESGKCKTVMIIDDDVAFVDFIVSHLSDTYRMVKMYSAEKALTYLLDHYVDLIISDVSLPQMSGLELCEAVKNDRRFSYIPVILLTNEVSKESRLAGISAGADAYIVKPCYLEYLVSNIENLLKCSFALEASNIVEKETSPNLVYTRKDEQFMDKLSELIYEHVEEFDLNVDSLADMMNMSRATLYRRVKESMSMTPNDFIRTLRLKKAAELLRQKQYRVNEIAYFVGFSSSSYFSKCFKKQYGVLPKDFI